MSALERLKALHQQTEKELSSLPSKEEQLLTQLDLLTEHLVEGIEEVKTSSLQEVLSFAKAQHKGLSQQWEEEEFYLLALDQFTTCVKILLEDEGTGMEGGKGKGKEYGKGRENGKEHGKGRENGKQKERDYANPGSMERALNLLNYLLARASSLTQLFSYRDFEASFPSARIRLQMEGMKRRVESQISFTFFLPFARDLSTVNINARRVIGLQGSGEGLLGVPKGLSVDDADRLFVADYGNHCIHCYDSEGGFVFDIGRHGSLPGEFCFPCDVHFDHAFRRLLVADSKNCRVQAFDPDGNFLFAFGKEEGKPFQEPRAITTDREGNIFICDYKRQSVGIFDPDGNYIRDLGADPEVLKKPSGIAFMANGNFAISDQVGQTVQIFDDKGKLLSTVLSRGQIGFPNWICVDDNDNIYVAEIKNRSVVIATSKGEIVHQIGVDYFIAAWAIAVNRKGQILISAKLRLGEICFIFVF